MLVLKLNYNNNFFKNFTHFIILLQDPDVLFTKKHGEHCLYFLYKYYLIRDKYIITNA